MESKELIKVLLSLVESYKRYVKTEPQHFMTYDVHVGLNIQLLEYNEKKEQQVEDRCIGENFSPHDWGYASLDEFRDVVVEILEENGLEYLGHFDE